MKILHVIDHWGLGGAQRALSVLLEIEQKNDHHVVVLFSHRKADWPVPKHCHLRFLCQTYSGIPKLSGRLRREIREHHPDLIHVHLTGSRFITALALRRMQMRPRVIWHEHSGNEYSKRFGSFVGGMLEWLQRRMAGSVKSVVANSTSSRTHCQNVLGISPERVHVIPCSVIPERILSEASLAEPADLSVSQREKPILGFVGRLAKQKGPFDFLEVANRLVSDGSVKTIWIIGEGPARRSMERRVARMADQSRFVFWRRRDDVYSLMRCLDVVVMPSHFEPFGLVAAESIALNTPVVGYDVDGLSDVLRSNTLGIPVTPGDVDELTEKTRQAIQHPAQASWTDGRPEYMDRQCAANVWGDFYSGIPS